MRLSVFVPVVVMGCGVGSGGSQHGEDYAAPDDSTACEPGTVVEGVDLSAGQGTVDWASAAADGIQFGIVKATQGTYNTQSNFSDNWSGMQAAGVLRSAYHFFDPTEDGVAQANHFLAVMGPLAAGDLPPMLDIECPDSDNSCLGWSGGTGDEPGSTIQQRMMDFLNTVQSATGRMPIIYTFRTYFSGNGVDTTGLQTYPLDIADPTTSNCFQVPAPWSAATMWQYSWTGSVAGISGGVDRDRFLGSYADLQALAGGGGGGGSGSDMGSDMGSGSDMGGGGGGPNGCNSATLAANVPSGTCVQAASDEQWYTCDNGTWVDGENNCTATYAWCDSATLGRAVPPRTCVQARSDSNWYQCDANGWDTPVTNGAGPLGACSAQFPL
jgi:lysozyme